MKQKFCRYVNGATDDSGTESVRLYIPVENGYVNYNIVHSVSPTRRCDTWRLSVAYLCDGQLSRIRPLTRAGAEWEMALKLKGRPDFIGGFAHGDEAFDKAVLTVDGRAMSFDELCCDTAFENLALEVWSVGYDPCDVCSKTILHYKKIIADKCGVRVEQRVEWLEDREIANCFMAMLPPYKSETDTYYTGSDSTPRPIGDNANVSGRDRAIFLTGKTGLTFGMKVKKYVSDVKGGMDFLISDNGGVPYNKMYFYVPHGDFVEKGTVWETVTEYFIAD